MTHLEKSTEAAEEDAGHIPLASAERNKLRILFAAHVILGLLFAIWSAVEGRLPITLSIVLVVPVFGFVLAQTALLGFWAVFSSARGWMRLVGVIMGCVYLEFLLRIGGQSGDNFGFLATMATVGIGGLFAVIRWRYAILHRLTQPIRYTNKGGLKFSIRGLMSFTFVVAVLIIGIRGMREHMSPGPSFLVVAVWGLDFVVIGLAGVWAALGVGQPLARILVALLVSAVLGIVFGYVIAWPIDFEIYFYFVSMMVLDAALVILSLLVVRSCGYRLVWKSHRVCV